MVHYCAIFAHCDLLLESNVVPNELFYKTMVSVIDEQIKTECPMKKFDNMLGLTFYYYTQNDYTFFLINNLKDTTKSTLFLLNCQQQFTNQYVLHTERSTFKKSKAKKWLQNLLDEHFNTLSKMEEIQNDVNETTIIMQDNIKKTINRGEKLEDLQNGSSNLKDNAELFAKDASTLRCKKCRNYYFCCCFCCF